MAKYSDEFKLMIVREYLNGPLGYKRLVYKYEMKSHTQLRNWVNIYKNQGAVGLSRKKTNKIYSVQKLLEGGAEALHKPKGRPAMSDKAKNTKRSKHPIQDNEMARKQKLERENELLRLEVEYLKKLRAFQMNPEGYLEKHKQCYNTNSKKNSN